MITENNHKELYSNAWLRAVASVAKFSATEPGGQDDDSIDITLHRRGLHGTIQSPKIDVQLKCTARPLPTGDFNFSLPIKNYNDLRSVHVATPRILVVVAVPEDVQDWCEHSHAELILRRSGYWVDLRDEPATSNKRTVSVTVPFAQALSPQALESLARPRTSGGIL